MSKFKVGDVVRRIGGRLRFSVLGVPETCYVGNGMDKEPGYTMVREGTESGAFNFVAVTMAEAESMFEIAPEDQKTTIQLGLVEAAYPKYGLLSLPTHPAFIPFQVQQPGLFPYTYKDYLMEINSLAIEKSPSEAPPKPHPHADILHSLIDAPSQKVWIFMEVGEKWAIASAPEVLADWFGKHRFSMGDYPVHAPIPVAKVGDRMIPRPVRVAPAVGTIYFAPGLGGTRTLRWHNTEEDKQLLLNCCVYLSQYRAGHVSNVMTSMLIRANAHDAYVGYVDELDVGVWEESK